MAQVALSIHLIWANTAYQDEALYLLTGHLEWSHWLYGRPIPQFQTYFSGAPVIYPPIGAAADALGGLAAARALSLCFMLGATTALHGVTKRIFGRIPAAFAAALFAGVGATQYLGAFATYDALALTLLAVATWLGVRAVGAGRSGRLALLMLAGLVLVMADATKYAAALFDPVVVLTVVFFAWQRRGRRGGFGAGMIMCAVVALAGSGALVAGDQSYWRGITFTTLTRTPGSSAPWAVLTVSLGWAGMVAALAVIGTAIVICTSRDRAYRALGITFALAVWVAPAEQARIETFTSLFKHVGFGEWFGAILAGFALASITSAVPRVKAEEALRVAWATVMTSAVIGFMLATNQFASWPNITAVVNVLRPLLAGNRHTVLAADNGNVLEYYIPQGSLGSKEYFIDDQAQWQATFTKNELIAYAKAIQHGYFAVITLSGYRPWASGDNVIRTDITKYKDYKLAASIPYIAAGEKSAYGIWVYKGSR